jgi:gliding motility-associated-like protein
MRKLLLLSIIVLFNAIFFNASAQTLAAKNALNNNITSLAALTSCAGSPSTSNQTFYIQASSLAADVIVTPPVGFEVSAFSNFTNVGTSASPLTLAYLPSTQFTGMGKQLYVRIAASASGTPNGNITISSTGATDVNVSISGTVGPPAPTVTVGSVASITTQATSFSLPFTTTGSPNQYTVTPDYNGRIMSSFNGMSYMNQAISSSPVSINTTGGGGMLVAGTYDFIMNVTNSTAGCISANSPFTVTVTTPVVPSLSASATLTSFSTCAGVASAGQAVNLTGTNLGNAISVRPPAGFEVSNTSNFSSVYTRSTPFLTLNTTAGVLSTTFYIRLSAATIAGTYTSSTFSYMNDGMPVGTMSMPIFPNGTVTATPSITLGSVNGVSATATSFDIPYSATTGAPNQYSVIAGSNAMTGFTAVSNATLSSSPITVAIPAGQSGTKDFNLTVKNSTTGCSSTNNAISLVVAGSQSPTPTVSSSATTLATINKCEGYSSAMGGSFTVSGNNIGAGGITITPPVGFELSTDMFSLSGTPSTNASPLIISQSTISSHSVSVNVRFVGNSSASGNISIASTGATTVNVAVNGVLNTAPTATLGTVSDVLSSATSFTLPISSTTGSPNQYFVMAGSRAMNNFLPNIGAISGNEITVNVPALKTIGTYDFTLGLTNTTTSCSATAPTNFTVNVVSSIAPAATATLSNVSTLATCAGTASAAKTIAINATGLTSALDLTPPVNFEISTTADFASAVVAPNSLSIAATAGTVSTTVYVRLSSNATAGNYNGSISFATASTALSTTVALTGTVNALPTIAVGTISTIRAVETSFAIPYTATTGSPNTYSISAGSNALPNFTSVSNASLATSPINVTIPPTLPGSYNFILQVKNSSTGCVASDIAIPLSIMPVLDSITGPGLLCGKSSIQLANTTQGGVWSSANANLVTVNANGKLTGIGDADGQVVISYSVTIGGVSYAVTKTINYIGSPILPIKMPIINVAKNQPTPVQARAFGTSYNWVSNSSSSNGYLGYVTNAKIANPNLVISADAIFNIEIKAANGCVTVDTLQAKVFSETGVYLPTAFSPNNDGVNDVFQIYAAGVASLKTFRIVNQFGQVVFETTNLSQGWDGRTNGSAQPIATYIWLVEATDIYGAALRQTGSVTLIR